MGNRMKIISITTFMVIALLAISFEIDARNTFHQVDTMVTTNQEALAPDVSKLQVINPIATLKNLDGLNGALVGSQVITGDGSVDFESLKNIALGACGFWDWFLGSLTGSTHPKPGSCDSDCDEGEHSCGPKNCSCCADEPGTDFNSFTQLVNDGRLDQFLNMALFVGKEDLTNMNFQDLVVIQQMILTVKMNTVR